jgi:hypothetical protein
MDLAAGDPFNTSDKAVGERLKCLANSFKLIGFRDFTWLGRAAAVDFVDSTPVVSHVLPAKTIIDKKLDGAHNKSIYGLALRFGKSSKAASSIG